MPWRHVVPAMLCVVGAIHLLPLPGLLGGDRLAALYGVIVDEPNLSLLMRHRAVLFGLLGAFMIGAAFRPPLHVAALAAGLLSVASFLLLAAIGGAINPRLERVVVVDVVALVCLLAGVVVHRLRPVSGLAARYSAADAHAPSSH
jgi:hypothetical protein